MGVAESYRVEGREMASAIFRRVFRRSAGLAIAAVAALAIAGCAHRESVVVYPPPPGYTRAAQMGYHDGVRAAQHDLRHGARPDVDRHEDFRNPPVVPPEVRDYRHAFREGYLRVMHRGPDRGY